jgi:ElaB/YqjD/DUF883 family membrane-anchored ribosome-binding protein
MDNMHPREIIRQLAENTSEIIGTSADGKPETLTALANRQKTLTHALNRSLTDPGDLAPPDVKELKNLVEKAIETVKAEMGANRSSMQAAGVKKKVLSAYGNVTVSASAPPR